MTEQSRQRGADSGAASDTVRRAGSATPGALARFRDRDHTRGNLITSLVSLSVPLLGSSVLGGVLFQLGDLKLVSGLGASATTAVIVTNQSWKQLLIMLVMGASFGAQGLIARHVGGGDSDGADHVAGQLVLLGLLLSSVVAVLGFVFAEPMLAMMHVSDEVLEVGTPYMRLVFLLNFGFVFIFLFNSILNGAGDSTTPLFITVIQTFVALLAEWTLIYGHFGAPALGIRGVVIGLAIGHATSMILAFRVLFSGGSRVHLRAHHMRPDWAVIRRILKLAWPPALQMMSGFMVAVFFIRLMGDLGDKAQAAYSIGLRLSMIGPMVSFPIAGACATLVGQNLGAGDPKRAWQSLRIGLLAHVLVLWSFAAVIFFFREAILGAFSQDPEVVRIGSELLSYQAASFAFIAFNLVFLRTLQGAGDVLVPMLMSLGNSLFITLPLGLYLSGPAGMGPTGVFVAGLCSAISTTLMSGSWVATGRWARRKPFAR
jgi:putative MATE family efflux protein